MQDENIKILGVFLEVKNKDYHLIDKVDRKKKTHLTPSDTPKDQMTKSRLSNLNLQKQMMMS